MRILWHSNAPWASTGYGNQTKLFVQRLQAEGHELGISAFYGLQGAILNLGPIPVYPKGMTDYGTDVLAAHATHFGADIAISLIDAWVMDAQQFSGIKWVPWFPVDMEPLPPPVASAVAKAYRRIVFSRFGERMVNDAGMDAYYIPHGVDTKVYFPTVQAEARAALGWPADRFIVGMVAANKDYPSRKNWPAALAAFADFAKLHPDAMLYAHTQAVMGTHIPDIAQGLGIGDRVLIVDQYKNLLGIDEQVMRAVYSGMDVLLNPASGEGFGIPILEAQACATPVIVGDWTAMSELCFGGYAIPKHHAEKVWTPLNSYQWTPTKKGILHGLNWAYKHARNPLVKQKAYDGAQAYDVDKVVKEYWVPVLADIEKAVKLWQ